MAKDKVEAEETKVGESAIAKELAPQGSVIEPVLVEKNGVPYVTPTSGYDGHYPVQFSNEADEDFAGRVAQFEGSYASALINELGGTGAKVLEIRKSALKAKYNADVLALDAAHKLKTPNNLTPPTTSKVVESKDGSTKNVDANYKLEDGEKFV